MNSVRVLTETEAQARMIHLSSPVTIQNPTTPINRTARELRLASAPAGVHRPPSSAGQPKTLAEAIRDEQLAGGVEHAADRAATKYPALVTAWLAELQNCADSESAS